jgi:hypothetical protein
VNSVNVPVPGRVSALAGEVAADLTARQGGTALGPSGAGASARSRDTPADAGGVCVRDDRTLVAKRLPEGEAHRVEARAREALSGTPPFEVRVDRVDWFAEPTAGSGPVVYLAVESPGLWRLHDRLCRAFDPVPGLEGEEYTPHVTVARGGSLAAAEAVLGSVEPVEWTVTELQFWDATRKLVAGRVSLPA